MVETAIKQRAINYIETLDDEQTLQVITYIQTMPRKNNPMQNSKTESERIEATNALAELDQIRLHLKPNPADDDKKAIANAIWKKYESLD